MKEDSSVILAYLLPIDKQRTLPSPPHRLCFRHETQNGHKTTLNLALLYLSFGVFFVFILLTLVFGVFD
ncbi:hypothetical protein SK128_015003 [Halocaridina rubra]|uniref:Uncharacterized protein n=1 Tax=Halocaridina rubra TaxID=373956 RepID=A0AAN9A8V0_HALRR